MLNICICIYVYTQQVGLATQKRSEILETSMIIYSNDKSTNIVAFVYEYANKYGHEYAKCTNVVVFDYANVHT